MDGNGGATVTDGPAWSVPRGARPHPTPEERWTRGRSARTRVPRSSHAEIGGRPGGTDPVALLEEQATTRVPELVPIRHGRMLRSPFTFYRGAALVMAADLAETPDSGLIVQACGDAHLSNFGIFGTPERNLTFDVNDFDETLPGPWEWDVKRLAASLAVAARCREFSEAECRDIVSRTVRSYRTSMLQFAGMRHLEVWYARLDPDRSWAEYGPKLTPQGRRRTERAIAKARTHDSLEVLDRLTEVVDGVRRIVSQPPVLVPLEELVDGETFDALRDQAVSMMDRYRRSLGPDRRHLLEQFRVVQIARKVVGVGSVGTRSWIMLLMGRDDDDPLFLQMKEAEASVLERFHPKSTYDNHGQRVVTGQRLMQASSDILLGWERNLGMDGVRRDFYIRQLRDWKASADVERMFPPGMAAYGELCAWTLARAYARSGDRIAIAAYLGKTDVFDRAVATYAEFYADRNERDYEAFGAAVAAGRLEAVAGV